MSNVQGLNELISKLDSLGGNIALPCIRGVKKTARKIQRDAKLNLTDNESVETGLLRASIHTDTEIKQDEIIAKVSTDIEYRSICRIGNRSKRYSE